MVKSLSEKLCIFIVIVTVIVSSERDVNAMASKKRKGSYKQYLGPDVGASAEEPKTSKWRRQDGAHTLAAQDLAPPLSHRVDVVSSSLYPLQDFPEESCSPVLLDCGSGFSAHAQTPTSEAQMTLMHASIPSVSGDVLQACAAQDHVGSGAIRTGFRESDGIISEDVSAIASKNVYTCPIIMEQPSALGEGCVTLPLLSNPASHSMRGSIPPACESSCSRNDEVPSNTSSEHDSFSSNESIGNDSIPSNAPSEVDEVEVQWEVLSSEGEQSSRGDSPLPSDQDEEHEEQQPQVDGGEELEDGEQEPQGEDDGALADDQQQPQEEDGEELEGQEQQPEGDEHQAQGNEDHEPNEDQPLPGQGQQGVPPQNYHNNPSHPKLHQRMQGDYEPIIDTNVSASRNDALYMALGLARRSNFSNISLLNCINLINNLFVSPILPNTLDLLDGLLITKQFVRYFFFCKNCMNPFGELDYKHVKTYDCPNPDCRVTNVISDLRKAQFFVMFSIPYQLQNLLQDPKIRDALLTPVEAAAMGREGFISDLWSGSMYRKFVAAVMNIAGRIFSFHFCVDGSPLATSSLCSIWPLQLALNELPPNLRMKNLLLCGLWFGLKPAKMDIFLAPFVDHFRELSAGFNIKIGNNIEHCRAFCTGCCVDSGARGKVQGIKTHSGYYSCNWCTVRGQWIGHAVKFPLTPEEAEPRSHHHIVTTQRNFGNDPQPVEDDEDEDILDDPGVPDAQLDLLGVNGVSPLINLPHLRTTEGEIFPSFDMVKSFFVDCMHMLDLGIGKYFLTRWMEDFGHGYYIKGSEQEINNRIKSLHPPIEFRRLPRVLSERARFNSREYFNWTMFVSVPVLTGILQNKYLQVWLLLVQAYYFLSLTEISNDFPNIAERLINAFLQKTQEYYHAGDMTFNLHILLHLIAHVLLHGPTWASCAYCFEDGNGRLKRLIHSNQGIPHQIIRSLSWSEAMKVLEGVVSEKAKHYVSTITTPEQHRQKSFAVADAQLIGKAEVFNPSDAERFQFQQYGHDEDNLVCYPKVVYKNCSFTDSKNRSIRHDNSVAQLNNKSLVLVRRIVYDSVEDKIFLLASDIHFETILVPPAGVQIQRDDHFMRRITHINEEIQYVKCQDLKIICFRATLPSGDFVAPFPNVHNRQ